MRDLHFILPGVLTSCNYRRTSSVVSCAKTVHMRHIFIVLFWMTFTTFCAAQAQDVKLAQHYYRSGEYEKSATIFKKLSDRSGFQEYYFNQYIESLMALEDYDTAIKAIQIALKKHPGKLQLYVTYGNLLERQGKMEQAEQEYRHAIEQMGQDIGRINALGNAFTRMTKYELARETFEKGMRIVGDQQIFAYNLAEIYRRKNETQPMIHHFLNSQMAVIERISSVQNYFAKYLRGDEDYEILRKELYKKVQAQPDNIFFPEMIEWVFIRSKDYDKALRQARALDRRLNENGSRIYALAQIAANDRDYNTALKAYQYIVDDKDPQSSYYIDAKKELLDTKRKKIIYAKQYTKEDLMILKNEYVAFLDEMGRGRNTAFIILELAQLEGLYLNDLSAAIQTLSNLLEMPGTNNYVIANAKLALGDYFLMDGNIWDATLLYSQVDKQFKEDFLGEKARFKNAKLSYYIGDFEWAQEQFDILKSATSKLISNDAIDLSVFIMDNANLDTTYLPLALFAEAELLIYQNRIDEAFSKMDSITILFPEHGLEDDVLFVKAQQYEIQQRYEEAAVLYQEIIDRFSEEIRADNALWALAQLYEFFLDDLDQAQELYQRLFIDYSDSTFSVDARKRFRMLRGDGV